MAIVFALLLFDGAVLDLDSAEPDRRGMPHDAVADPRMPQGAESKRPEQNKSEHIDLTSFAEGVTARSLPARVASTSGKPRGLASRS